MNVFQDLKITVPENSIAVFRNELLSNLPQGWKSYDRLDLGPKGMCFSCDKNGEIEAADLFFYQQEQEAFIFVVTNICPKDFRNLTKTQYNLIVDNFKNQCVAPVATKLNAKIDLSPDNVTVEDILSEESARKLRNFSSTTNKSTGNSHPSDKDRWYDFVISVYERKDELDYSTLYNLLTEDLGWQRSFEETARELSSEFEHEIGLLKHYGK